MGSPSTTTRTRYRALRGQADEGLRGLLALVTRWLGFEQALVFLVGPDGDFTGWVALNEGVDPFVMRPFGLFALAQPEPMVVGDLAETLLGDEPSVREPGGFRGLAAMRLLSPEGLLIGSLCMLGREAREAQPGDSERLSQIGLQVGRWVQMRASLRELEARHHQQLDRLHQLEGLARAGRGVALVAVGPGGQVQWLNQGAEALMGQTSGGLRGRSVDGLLRDEQGTGLWAQLEARGDVEEWPGLLWRATAPLPVAVTLASVRDESGAVTGFVLALRDRTHQRQIEQLQRELVASLHHELRTPLAVVSASLDLLDGLVEGEANELVGMARTGAVRLGRLVEDVLALQTLAEPDFRLQTERCEASSLLTAVAAAGAERASQRGVKIAPVAVTDPGTVLADEPWARRACDALLDHALERSAAGGTVSLEVRTAVPGQVRLCVRDEAPPPTSEPSAVAPAQGLRLALSVARAVAQHHGGQVGWEPGVPRGCVFYLALPAAT